MAGLPNLESLRLADALLTPKGLAHLSSLDSLEELAIEGDPEDPAAIEALADFHSLKALHLHNGRFGASRKALTAVKLDDQANVYVTDRDRFLAVIAALRKSIPGIVVDTATYRVQHQDRDSTVTERCFGYDALPNHEISWLPTGGAPWMTAAERLWFDSEGGWARFDAAGWRAGSRSTTHF